MWQGPYGDGGSKKYLVASLDQSLKRMGLDYVDIVYHHRPDPNTPLEETVRALDGIVKSGKALYIGISNYNREQTMEAVKLFNEYGTPFIINQRRYSIFDRTIENDGLKDYAASNGIGVITFCPLEQGVLTDRYINGIPEDSRVRTDGRFLKENAITEEKINRVKALRKIAAKRGQTLAQMALSWIFQDAISRTDCSVKTIIQNGIDGLEDALEAIKNGKMQGTFSYKIKFVYEKELSLKLI